MTDGDDPTAPLNRHETAALRRLLDHQAVVDCVTRYARGVDRADADLLRATYHPDAREDHGTYVGGREGLLDFLAAAHAPFSGYQRYVTNHTVEVDGDDAHAESYYLCVLRAGGESDGSAGEDGGAGGRLLLNGGRYVDRLRRSEDGWVILRRVVVGEWEATLDGGAPRYPTNARARRDRDDISYRRPLEVPAE